MTQNKVSIIIPAYNVEKYIKKCIDSIINQNYHNLEIIIVNDGSTDSTLQICKEYAEKDSRIKVLSQNNSGVSSARNTGIEHATGEWLMFVDSDDWLDEKLSSIIPKLDLQNDVYLFAFSKHSDRKTEIIGLGKQISFEREDFENLQRWILNQYLYPVDYAISAPWGKIYCRRFIVENNCRFPEGIKMGEDKIFNLQVFEFAQKAAYLNITFYNYRVYQKSTVNRYNKYIIADVEAMLNRLADCLKQYNKYNKFKTDYNIRIIMSIMYFITLDFCHVENTQKYIIREKNFINLVTQKTYKNAIKEVNGYSFPIRQKVLFFMIKIKCFFLIEQLNKLNRIYEKIKEDK